MKKYNQPIDDFFRDALSNHTVNPSEKAKAAFLKEATEWAPVSKSRNRKYLFLLGGMLIIFAGLGIYFAKDNSVSSGLQKSQLVNSTEKVALQSSTEPGPISATKPETKPAQETSLHQNMPQLKPVTQNTIDKPVQKNNNITSINATKKIETSINDVTSSTPDKQDVKTDIVPTVPADQVNVPEKPVVEIQPESISKNSEEISGSAEQIPDTIIIPGKQHSTEKRKNTPNTNRSWDISSGVYYTPEWMFNLLEGDKFVNSFGLEGTFRVGKYSVRSGVGLSITKGTNELSISYNDYLGNFQKLDSMTFRWNDQHTKLVPTYYLSDKNVYDSLMKLDNAKIVRRYTYLQVPLILGYDFLKNEKFSFGLRAGPILSILLESKKISGDYEPGKNQIISINQISPDRIQTNWQVMAGVNASFNFSRKFGIELEPQVKYYFNSVYEQSDNTDKPWSVGIRAALYLKY